MELDIFFKILLNACDIHIRSNVVQVCKNIFFHFGTNFDVYSVYWRADVNVPNLF